MKVKIQVPDSLNEITLVQYQAFLKRSDGLDENQLKALMLEVFCLLKPEQVQAIERSYVDEVAVHIDSLFTRKKQLISKFPLGGVMFGFIPNLDEITFGEYVDLDTYIGDWSNMHKAMSVLYRPIVKDVKGQYLIAEYEGTDVNSELMKLMPLDVVLSAQVFFWNLGKELLAALPSYLEKQGKQIIRLAHSSGASGDGTAAFTNSLREMLERLTMSLESSYPQPSPFSNLNQKNNA